MKTFIAEDMEVAECELESNGYPVTQQGAAEYARKLWARCPSPASKRSKQLKALYGPNYRKFNRHSL